MTFISNVRDLGDQDHFNDVFARTDRNYTYLVPANSAWEKIGKNFASTYKILFNGMFPTQVSPNFFQANILRNYFFRAR